MEKGKEKLAKYEKEGRVSSSENEQPPSASGSSVLDHRPKRKGRGQHAPWSPTKTVSAVATESSSSDVDSDGSSSSQKRVEITGSASSFKKAKTTKRSSTLLALPPAPKVPSVLSNKGINGQGKFRSLISLSFFFFHMNYDFPFVREPAAWKRTNQRPWEAEQGAFLPP